MTFNKSQKIATIVYFLSLVSILLFFTPYSRKIWAQPMVKDFGNLFTINDIIDYQKNFIEIGVLTVAYVLSIIMLKSSLDKRP